MSTGAHGPGARRLLLAALLLAALVGGARAPTARATGHWSAPRQIVPEDVGLDSVSCLSRSFCGAVGSEDFASYDGKSWTKKVGVDGQDLLSVSCPEAGACFVGDSSGQLALEASSWSLEAVDEGAEIDSVSCSTQSFCAAVDNSGGALIDTQPGTEDSQAIDIDGVETLSSVSCVSATFCVAVDVAGDAFTFNGLSWSEARVDHTGLESVSCAGVNFCLAVDEEGDALIFDGHSWGRPRAVDSAWLSSVSCAAANSCVAVDLNGRGLVDEGGTWSRPSRIDGENTLSDVSCSSSDFCVAVDLAGNEVTYEGRGKGRASPKPGRWPLPDPCRLPQRELEDFVGRGVGQKDEKLTKQTPDTAQARATCTFYPSSPGPHSTIYIGYTRPPQPSAGVTTRAIPGWEGAELTDSNEPSYGNEAYFWIVTFKREFHGHALWGQTWWRGSSCTPGDPAGARTAESLYEAVGPGPKVSVPAPHHVPNPCTG